MHIPVSLMNTLNSGRVTRSPLLSSIYRSYNRIPQSKSNKRGMHIMLMGHNETDLSISSYFVTLSLENPKAPCSIWILAQW